MIQNSEARGNPIVTTVFLLPMPMFQEQFLLRDASAPTGTGTYPKRQNLTLSRRPHTEQQSTWLRVAQALRCAMPCIFSVWSCLSMVAMGDDAANDDESLLWCDWPCSDLGYSFWAFVNESSTRRGAHIEHHVPSLEDQWRCWPTAWVGAPWSIIFIWGGLTFDFWLWDCEKRLDFVRVHWICTLGK